MGEIADRLRAVPRESLVGLRVGLRQVEREIPKDERDRVRKQRLNAQDRPMPVYKGRSERLNLTESGDLLDSIRARLTPGRRSNQFQVEVTVTEHEDVGRIWQRRTNWFGASPRQRRKYVRMLARRTHVRGKSRVTVKRLPVL